MMNGPFKMETIDCFFVIYYTIGYNLDNVAEENDSTVEAYSCIPMLELWKMH